MVKRVVTLRGEEFSVAGPLLQIGEKAPAFTLVDNELNEVSLSDFKQDIKLISIVPSLDTEVCHQQTRRFNEEISKIPNAVVITVSVDLPFAQKRWCGSAGLQDAVTLSDHRDVSFGQAYGVLIEDLRLLARAVLVLDERNTVTYCEYLAEVSEHPDYEGALKAIKALV